MTFDYRETWASAVCGYLLLAAGTLAALGPTSLTAWITVLVLLAALVAARKAIVGVPRSFTGARLVSGVFLVAAGIVLDLQERRSSPLGAASIALGLVLVVPPHVAHFANLKD